MNYHIKHTLSIQTNELQGRVKFPTGGIPHEHNVHESVKLRWRQ